MVRDSLGIFTTEDHRPFPFAVFKEPRGLNFLSDHSLYANPTTEYRRIGPKVIAEWSK